MAENCQAFPTLALHTGVAKINQTTQNLAVRRHRAASRFGGHLMYFVAAVLAVLSGLFYAAGHHEIGSLGVEMCRYGSTFCDNPVYVLAGAILAALWGAFVSIR
jgi:hypothetical protein